MLAFVMLGHGRPTRARGIGCACVLLGLSACAGDFSALDPGGPAAARVAELWWWMLGGAMLILLGVMAAALYALRRERRGRNISDRAMLIGGGLVFPIATLAALLAFALLRGEQLLARDDPGVLAVEVRAAKWAWEFRYPEGGRTLNALHVPAGRDFQIHVTSDDVIHSIWVPRLGGKIDALPGRVNRISLRADEPGLYRGLCAEYCGIGHARMLFEVHAHPAEDYEARLAEALAAAPQFAPPLVERREPARNLLDRWADYLFAWLGVR
jgi:cytochrome c oxidase subunit II